MERRKFIKRTGGILGGLTVGASALSAKTHENLNRLIPVQGKVPRRKIISSGEEVSIIGFPGNALRHYNQQETNDGVHWAIDNGLNLFDVAPAYGKDGECEIKLGKALEYQNRSNIFLACKTGRRDKKGAKEELERSLKRLKTDYFDLYQMHYLRTLEEVEEAFGPNGCMETILQAKKEGKVRHIGFSAHTSLSALAVMDKFKFDTAMFPINFIEHFSFAFGQAVLEKAKNQGISVLAIKSTSGGAWATDVPKEKRNWWYNVINDEQNLNMALRFALSQHNVIAAIPASFLPHFQASVDAGKMYQAISKKEMDKLHAMAKESQSIFLQRQEKGLTSFNGIFRFNGEEMC